MEDLLTYAAGIAAAWIGFQLIAAVNVMVQVLRSPVLPTRMLRQAPMPPLSPDQAALLDQLLSLGFELHWQGAQQTGDRVYPAVFLRHSRLPAFASVTFTPMLLTGYAVVFHSFDAQGRRLVTTNRLGWLIHTRHPDTLPADPYADSLEAHWQTHEARLAEACPADPEVALDAICQAADRAFDLSREAGAISLSRGTWHATLRTAWRIATAWLRVRRKLARPYACAATAPEHRPAFLVHCHAQAEAELQQRPARHNVKGALLVGSLVLSLVLWGTVYDWRLAGALAVVLFVHEMGHALAMRAFGWKDMSMFFIPFVGAMVTGRPGRTAAWKEALVLLAGPLPGLLAGVAALGWGPAAWRDIALIAVTVNLFNLLPITPLDGGQLVDMALFSRWPRLRAVFAALSVAGFAVVAYKLQSLPVAIIAGVLLLSLRHQWRIAAVQGRWQESLPEHEQLLALYQYVQRHWQRMAPVRQLLMVRAVARQQLMQRPRWWERLLALAVLAAVWAAAGPAMVDTFWPADRSAAAPHDTRSEAQKAFDLAFAAGEEAEDSRDGLAELAQKAAALQPGDPRHFDLKVMQAYAAEPAERRRMLEDLLKTGHDGLQWRRGSLLHSELGLLIQASFELAPPQRIERLREGIAWAEQAAPDELASTLPARLRLAEAIDDSGDGTAALALLDELQRRAANADDCRCELSQVVRARAWFHLSHRQSGLALATLEHSSDAEKMRQGKGALALDYAWALLLAGDVARGTAQMRLALTPAAESGRWPYRLFSGQRQAVRVSHPLDLAHALRVGGAHAEARALLQGRSIWQCRLAHDGWNANERQEPWQRERDRLIQDTARELCPAKA